jgi:hypothetical protein
MGDFETEHEIQNKIASLTFDASSGEWTDTASYFVECGAVSQVAGTVVDGAGVRQSPLASAELSATWRELRHAMADPAEGAWLSAHLLLSNSGQYRFGFNWDQRPSWPLEVGVDGSLVRSSPIAASALLEDAQLYPREREYEPDWMKELRSQSSAIVLTEPRWGAAWQGLLQDSGWSMVDDSVRSAVEALVLDGHLDPEETRPLAQQVFSEYVGSTVGNQMRYLARVAMESGVVQWQDLPAGELTEDSWDLLEGSEEFQQMLELLVPVFTELAEQRLRAQTLNPVPEKTGGLRLSEGDLK